MVGVEGLVKGFDLSDFRGLGVKSWFGPWLRG